MYKQQNSSAFKRLA